MVFSHGLGIGMGEMVSFGKVGEGAVTCIAGTKTSLTVLGP